MMISGLEERNLSNNEEREVKELEHIKKYFNVIHSTTESTAAKDIQNRKRTV